MFPKKDMANEKAMIDNWTPEETADGTRDLGGGAEGVASASDSIDVFEDSKNYLNQVLSVSFFDDVMVM